MDILLVMCAGILVGAKLFPKKGKGINEKMQLLCTLVLIFSMGVMLGKREGFLEDFAALGVTSFLYFLIPSALSLLFVFYLTKKFLKSKQQEEA